MSDRTTGSVKDLGAGLYIAGMVEQVPVVFTADTGASKTIVSTRVYDRMVKGERPELQRSTTLRGAGGSPIKERGQASFKLTLGPLEIVQEAIVAEIEDDALLGYDALSGGTHGPADILLSRDVIVLDGHEVPCIQKGRSLRTRKVMVADDIKIPGNAEAIVDVYIERSEDDDYDSVADYLVEPVGGFQDRYQLVMATTLVDINSSTTCRIRVMNPFSNEVDLRQDAEIASAEKIERVVTVISSEEHDDEAANFNSIRRVDTKSRLPNGVDRSLKPSPTDQIPDHLKELCERSTNGKSQHVRQTVAGLLCKYSNTFSRGDWDIGLTHLAEHPINTENAAPVKQRPRRVPLAYAEEEKKAIEDLLEKGVIQKSTSPWA
ncbi:MAG: retropepsin-like aspartic protease, partial [Sedimenticola sp.]